MEVFFYLPEKYLPDSARQEAWKAGKISALEPGGKIACAQCWIYQTWLLLGRDGFPAKLVHEIPDRGLMVSLAGFLSDDYRPPAHLFVAGIVADYLPGPGAHVHVVQNSVHARRLWNSSFMPLWPHPNLVPRDPARGDVFENICFFGDASNLAPELRDPAWRKKLRDDLGLRFVICDADRWHDYSEADAVIAIRSFDRAPHLHKPATKLYNAWLAGVPFIGGHDSAYAGDGQPGGNYLAAGTPGELLAELGRLKNDPALRASLVAAGRAAGGGFTPPAILGRWKFLLGEKAPELFTRWRRRSGLGRKWFFRAQSASVWLDRKLRR